MDVDLDPLLPFKQNSESTKVLVTVVDSLDIVVDIVTVANEKTELNTSGNPRSETAESIYVLSGF